MTTTHKATCHCGAVELAIALPDGPPSGARCNCSLCRRKGAIMIGVPYDALEVVRGAGALSCYEWNTRVAKHYFCSRCGIYTHHRRRSDPNQFGVNAGCIEGLELDPLGPARLADGGSMTVE